MLKDFCLGLANEKINKQLFSRMVLLMGLKDKLLSHSFPLKTGQLNFGNFFPTSISGLPSFV
jgi:hypothetical protein